MMNNYSTCSRYPFTQSQWKELENQALIYKYMASGIPIPSHLLLNIKRSFIPFTQPTTGWSPSYFQMGYTIYGRKEDPEPGRCRRTDGKKWRCSKEAYHDSKYCERHMHRGKNRSRKPVEISLATTTTTTNNISINNNSSFSSSSSSFSLTSSESHYPYPLMYPHPYYPQNNHPGFFLDSGSYSSSAERDYRYCQGMKDVDEYSFLSRDASGGERGSSWQFIRPLRLNNEDGDDNEEEEKKKHCFVLGADFKQEKPIKERDFFDGWPQNIKKTWMGLEIEGDNSNSKTQLSISIPMGLHDFPQWLVDCFLLHN